MTARELNIGDVFRIAGETKLWRKVGPSVARTVGANRWDNKTLGYFTGKELELVEAADPSEIRRSGDMLILKGGEVTLEFGGALLVYRCEPGEKFTHLIFAGEGYAQSRVARPTDQTALLFTVGAGAKHIGRGKGSDLFAYRGRIYARATHFEVTGVHKNYGYKRVLKIDGARRYVTACLLGVRGEYSLYDIMMEHFGPDTVAADPQG